MSDSDSIEDAPNVDHAMISDALLDRFDYESLDEASKQYEKQYLAFPTIDSGVVVNITMDDVEEQFLDNALLAYELSGDVKIIVVMCSSALVNALFKKGLGAWKLDVVQGDEILTSFTADLVNEEATIKLVKVKTQYELSIAWV
jgi:hypothetical protein